MNLNSINCIMRSMPFIMKNILLCCCLNLSILFGQFSYPAEDFLGGGIGYSPMYIKLDSLPGASYLTNLGLNPNNFDDPLVIHGGEGFAHVTGCLLYTSPSPRDS